MKTALLKKRDKVEITADEAATRNEEIALCPVCKEQVRLHRGKKIAHHFEHVKRIGLCPRHYNYRRRAAAAARLVTTTS